MAHNLSGECGEKPATPSVNESYQTKCWCIMRPDMMCGNGGTDRKQEAELEAGLVAAEDIKICHWD